MECNKDEAFRAKKIAEQKMVKNDFEGARKIALKAKQLFPDVDNISQLIAVCDIHCSAQKKIYGAEKDFYGILQVENIADEITIRKQYRKLALVLHPDKNKFPGAEAAFKLIGEANMILSDKGKRSVYDIKCREPTRVSVTKIQNRQGSQTSYAGQQNKVKNVPGSHGQQQSTSNPSIRLTFWTYCPFCNIKYEYYREFVNRPLRCQHCSKLFIAYDIGAQGPAAGPGFAREKVQSVNLGSKPVSQQKEAGKGEQVKVDIQKDGQFPSNFAHKKTEDTSMKQEGFTKPKVNNVQKPIETATAKDTNKKRGRKMAAESSESSSDEKEAVGGGGPGGDRRRSSRQRPQVSYREGGGGEFSPQKKSKLRKSSNDVEDMKDVSGCKDKSDVAHADVSTPNSKQKVNEEEAVTPDNLSKSDSEPDLVDCPDQEFTNFDKDKEEHCFAIDQIWACYDSVDGMPRFYAQIRKIYSSEFRLRFTWLESEPDNDLEIKWAEEGLPVACGNFMRGKTEETSDRLMFSHQIVYRKGGSKFSYVISPQKGEIWALYKDWDINWSLDPENHTKYKFDIVEIVSVHDDCVSVAFLFKVKGFVSVFQRGIWGGLAEHRIPLNQRFRFSHRVPSAKLTGTERAGVPAGSFELDMASLPADLEKYCYYYSNTVSQSHEENVKPVTNLVNTPKEHINSVDKDMLKLRRSPRRLESLKQENPNLEDMVSDGQNPSSACGISHDKQMWKFKVGQIWAFWECGNAIRQCYAEIKHIESQPFRLHVSLLKLCDTPSVGHKACGRFKVSSGKRKILLPDSFSHIVNAEACGKKMFNIYPREQQIWALCKSQAAGECEIVEVVETDEVSIKVKSLKCVPGRKLVFKAPMVPRSTAKIVVIPRVELNRFYHQIPAFLFTDGCLRGCWELDPAALKGLPLHGPNQG